MKQSEGSGMQNGWNNWCRGATLRSYRTGSGVLTVVGAIMIGAGLLLLFLCIPGWFWAALAGAALIVGGWLLITVGRR